MDQLSTLNEELLPSVPGQQRTLLEELEDLHVRLNELQNARSYVAVIEKALELRYYFVGAHSSGTFADLCPVSKLSLRYSPQRRNPSRKHPSRNTWNYKTTYPPLLML